MQLSEIYLALGQESFEQLLRTVSIGKLRSYQLYDRMKVRLHVSKINSEVLRKIGPKLWTRIASNDEEFATELAQAILISHLELIQKVLDFLGIPHDNGFFAKDSWATAWSFRYSSKVWIFARASAVRSRPAANSYIPWFFSRPRFCACLPPASWSIRWEIVSEKL